MISGDYQSIYGDSFAEALAMKQSSAFIAIVSAVAVRRGQPL
jgi:hypothetical protein